MSAATLTGPREGAREPDAPRLWDDAAPAAPPRPAQPADRVAAPVPPSEPALPPGAPTLEELVSEAWEGLSAHASVACPACGAEMRPRAGAGAGVIGGRCGGCATELA